MLWDKIQEYKIPTGDNYDKKRNEMLHKVALKPVPDDHLFCSAAAVTKWSEENYMNKLKTGCKLFSWLIKFLHVNVPKLHY